MNKLRLYCRKHRMTQVNESIAAKFVASLSKRVTMSPSERSMTLVSGKICRFAHHPCVDAGCEMYASACSVSGSTPPPPPTENALQSENDCCHLLLNARGQHWQIYYRKRQKTAERPSVTWANTRKNHPSRAAETQHSTFVCKIAERRAT